MARRFVRDAAGRFSGAGGTAKTKTVKTPEEKAKARQRNRRHAKTAVKVAGAVVGIGLAGGGLKVSRTSDAALTRHAQRAANSRYPK